MSISKQQSLYIFQAVKKNPYHLLGLQLTQAEIQQLIDTNAFKYLKISVVKYSTSCLWLVFSSIGKLSFRSEIE